MKSPYIYIMSAVLTCTALCCPAQEKTEKPTREVLYNGIVLPEVWPPRYPLPKERKEMPLPYIDNKPCPIIINVGRQLFVDDFLIDHTNLKRVNHHANMYPGNPVIPEGDTYSDGVWYDELDGKFKMWYRAPKGAPDEMGACYAESDDGYHWTRVDTGLFPDYTQQKNGVNTINGDSHVFWLDKEEKDPAKRYKYTCTYSRFFNEAYILQYSADGIHWGDIVVGSSRVCDRSTMFYNPFRKKWVMSLRIFVTPTSNRARGYIEDDSLERAIVHTHWVQDEIDKVRDEHIENHVLSDKHIVYWFSADDKELRHPMEKYADYIPAIYNFDANAYESVMFGEYAMSRGPENNVMNRDSIWKLNVVGVGFSRDGFHFARPDHEEFIECCPGDTTAWNGANMQAAVGNPLIVGDSLFFYTGAFPWRLNTYHGRTGMATLRRDGFVSMDAGTTEGTLTTSPVTFDGKYFFVNAEAKNLAVEVLDQQGHVIKGYSKDECVAMKDGNSTKFLITWNKKKNLAKLRNQNIRFKFYLTDGSLYAFWVSPWKTGESRGYTGGGGPGLHPSGRDLPVKK